MRVTGPLAGEEDIGRRAAEQAEDLAEARTALAGRPDVLPGALGLVGHSFGAPAALLYATREPDVAALVGLDGGIGTSSLRESPRWVVEVPESHHHHFTSLGASTLTHPGLGNALRATARTAAAYRAVADATLEFLDAFVRKDGPAATRVRARAVHPPLGRPQALGAGCR
jgi:pimeloyl-ACP methyl ester carboxylesterase